MFQTATSESKDSSPKYYTEKALLLLYFPAVVLEGCGQEGGNIALWALDNSIYNAV